VLIFNLKEHSRIALRPSGTEPKIKFYFSVNETFDPSKTYAEQQAVLQEKIEVLTKYFSRYDA